MYITGWLSDLFTNDFGGRDKPLKVIIKCRQGFAGYFGYAQ